MIHSNRGFPEEMSSSIAIVLRSYNSHEIFFLTNPRLCIFMSQLRDFSVKLLLLPLSLRQLDQRCQNVCNNLKDTKECTLQHLMTNMKKPSINVN